MLVVEENCVMVDASSTSEIAERRLSEDGIIIDRFRRRGVTRRQWWTVQKFVNLHNSIAVSRTLQLFTLVATMSRLAPKWGYAAIADLTNFQVG
jgi:hypothetical protein